MLIIRYEMSSDIANVEALLDRCFGPDRFAKTSYRFRDNVDSVHGLSLVAEMDGEIVGSIRYWPILAGNKPSLLLGPLGIEPGRQGQGIGRNLVQRTISVISGGTVSWVFLVGDPGYYHRFQFQPTPPHVNMPGEQPHRLQYRALSADRLPDEPMLIEPWPSGPTTLAEITGRQFVREAENHDPGEDDRSVIAEPT